MHGLTVVLLLLCVVVGLSIRATGAFAAQETLASDTAGLGRRQDNCGGSREPVVGARLPLVRAV